MFDTDPNSELHSLTKQELIDKYNHLLDEFQNFVRYIPDALIEVRVHLEHPRITFMNRMARVVFGYSEEEVRDELPLRQIFATDAEYQRIMEISRGFLEESLREKIPYQRTGTQDLWEVKLQRQNGEIFQAEAQSSTVLNDEGTPVKVRALFRDITDRKILERDREKLIDELQAALKNIQTLKGLLPICASCKKIRDDSGYWKDLEEYVEQHSLAEFSHGICPECMSELYPRYKRKKDREEEE